MAVRKRTRLGLREVRGLGENSEVWDSVVPGFGARRQQSAAIAYVLLFRTREGRARRYTIGRHGAPWTPDTARAEAVRLLGEVAKGNDPAAAKREVRRGETVADLCADYLEAVEAGRLLTRMKRPKKASTLVSDRSRIDVHIVPLLGRMRVAAVNTQDVERFLHDVAAGVTAGPTKTTKARGTGARVRGGMGAASRTVGLLGAIFAYAVRKRLRADNPVRGVIRPADGERKRRLAHEEYVSLGEALRAAADASVWPPAIAVARFLALTGWRSGEALGLRWQDIDLDRRTAILPDSKTGKTVRALSHRACDLLLGQSRSGELVFPATRGDGPMNGFPKLWRKIVEGRLPRDITPHVLRHSFASLAADEGLSEPTIAALIGHKGHSITGRYIHAADAVLLAAADHVADKTAELLGDAKPAGKVVAIKRGSG